MPNFAQFLKSYYTTIKVINEINIGNPRPSWYLFQFPTIGIYIVMFVTVLITFLQIMIILLIFIVAFALSFHMVLDKVSIGTLCAI